ncbi:hypothetical protein PSYMO_31157, partial [Pseudomonas amygdali pv. mori str. 301020]
LNDSDPDMREMAVEEVRETKQQLVELAVSREINGQRWLGVWSHGVFFPVGLEP